MLAARLLLGTVTPRQPRTYEGRSPEPRVSGTVDLYTRTSRKQDRRLCMRSRYPRSTQLQATGPAPAWGWQVRDVAGAQAGRGTRIMMSGLRRDRPRSRGEMRRGNRPDNGHGRKVLPSDSRPRIIRVEMYVRRPPRRRPRRPMGDVDDQGLIDGLSARIVDVQKPRQMFLRAKDSLGARGHAHRGPSSDDAQREVRRIVAATQRVGVLSEDHVAHVVDQVPIGHGDQGRRRSRPLDPDLSQRHPDRATAGVACWPIRRETAQRALATDGRAAGRWSARVI